jgi:sugar lactone lactonase YvrE
MHNEVFATQTHGRVRRTMAIVAVAGVLSAGIATTTRSEPHAAALNEAADGQPTVRTYILPGDEVFPEGIAVHGDTYYVTSSGGDIYRGDLDEAEAEVFISLGFFVPTGGIKATGRRLVVARGQAGIVGVFDRITGALVRRFANGLSPEETQINDVTIAPNGDAYLTDSIRPVLYRIPAAALRQPSAAVEDVPVFLEWEGTPFPNVPGAVNANGIVATPDGKYLLVVNFETGGLFRVRLSDKQVTQVDLGGYTLTGGDGMVLTKKNVLYVVRFFDSLVAKFRLTDGYRRGQLLSETTDPSFQGPTTAAIAGERLLVVNSQFSGPGTPPFTVSSIRLP